MRRTYSQFSLFLTFLLVIAGWLTACNEEIIVPTPIPGITPGSSLIVSDAAQSLIPTPLPPLDEATLESTPELSPDQQALEQAFLADLGIQLAPDGSTGIQAIASFETTLPTDRKPLWVAYTVGIRSFDPLQNHVIAIYRKNGEQWNQVTRFDMADSSSATDDANQPDSAVVSSSVAVSSSATISDTNSAADGSAQPNLTQVLSPDYLGQGSVFPVTIEPTRLWLQVDGGAGAHSGVFALLSFDGASIKQEASAFSASPAAGVVEDVNADGIGEVVIDSSDYYVFCYACGVRQPHFSILRWDGTAMIPVEPQYLPATVPSELRTITERMIVQTKAGLWKDALTTLAQLSAQSDSQANEITQWNMAWVRVNGEARKLQAESQESAYLLLDQVFYGDFATAVDAMRGYNPESIFSSQTPLIIGTVAEGNQESLSNTLLASVAGALELYPNAAASAPAYFLRAWAYYLLGNNTDANKALQEAIRLAPDEKLYEDSLTLLEN